MKIRSLYCACNERTDNPLDHYEKVDCGATPLGRPERMPLEWIRAILTNAQGDGRHTDGKMTATRVLGCPRETMIKDYHPIVYDVRSGNSTYHGTILHKALEENARADYRAEVEIPEFEFGGYRVSGYSDVVAANGALIKDWKGHAETSHGFKYERFKKGKLDVEGAAQINLYRIGLAKARGVDPGTYRPKLLLVHGANVRHGSEPWFEAEQPIMSEGQILALRPFDDEDHPGTQPYTVADLMKQHAEADKAIKAVLANPRLVAADKTVAVDRIIAAMPLVGKNVWRWRWNKAVRRKEKQAVGDKCAKYCAAARDCAWLQLFKQADGTGIKPPMPADPVAVLGGGE